MSLRSRVDFELICFQYPPLSSPKISRTEPLLLFIIWRIITIIVIIILLWEKYNNSKFSCFQALLC